MSFIKIRQLHILFYFLFLSVLKNKQQNLSKLITPYIDID